MVKTGIVCGCLPTQAGIEQSDLYHELMARNILDQTGIQLVISSIWYTTLSESKGRVAELLSTEDPCIILYHVRPDPYLRVSKLFIRYRDRFNRFHLSLNLDACDCFIGEKRYPPGGSLPLRKKSLLKSIFRDINYLLGISAGISHRVIDREVKLLKEILTACEQQQKQLILIGPASRPRSRMENYLLERLELKLAGEFKDEHFNYVTCFGTFGENHEPLFREDGVHVSKAGHRRMAELIIPVLKKVLRENFIDKTKEAVS